MRKSAEAGDHAVMAARKGGDVGVAKGGEIGEAAALVAERARLAAELPKLKAVKQVWPSDTNYLLVEVADSTKAMAAGRAAGVIWRDRSKDVPNSIRITVGTAEENNATLEVLSRV